MNEAALKAALEASRLVVWSYDIPRGRIRLSPEWSELMGYPRAEIETTPEALLRLVPPEERGRLLEAYAQAIGGQSEGYHVEHRVRSGDRTIWLLSSGRVVERDGAGRALRIAGTNADITRLKQAEAALRDKEAQLRLIIDAAPALIAYMDPGLAIRMHNKAYESWLGKPADEIDGRHSREVIGEEAFLQTEPYARRALAGESVQFEREQPAAGGERLHLAASFVPHRSPEGEVLGFFGLHFDITARKALERQNELMAHTDALTGLPNRRLLLDRLQQALALCARRKGRAALLFVDLDGFKKVNDGLGHEAGDALLVEVARRLAAGVRGSDTVARLGGDEFVVLLVDAGGRGALAARAQALIGAVQEPVAVDAREARVGASIGIACFPDHAGDAAGLMRAADAAMYQAKQAGRGTWRFPD